MADNNPRIQAMSEALELDPNIVATAYAEYDNMRPSSKKVIADWLADTFDKATRVGPFTSFVLTQMLENHINSLPYKERFKVSNKQLKYAMLEAGFKPSALEVKAGKAHWRFYIKMNRTQDDNAAQVLATAALARQAEGTLAADEADILAAQQTRLDNDKASSNQDNG